MVADSLNAQAIVGVLFLPEVGVCQAGYLLIWGEINYCRTRAASSRYEFVIDPFIFSNLTSLATMSTGQ